MATKDKLVNLEDLKSVYDHGIDLLDEKANQVGEYVDLTAGYADNLVSSSYVSDSEPYLFRKTFAGVREDTEIVGGSVVFNQLTKNGNFADTSDWATSSATLTASNNVGTLTASGTNPMIRTSVPIVSGHAYLLSMDFTPGSNTTATRLMYHSGSASVASITLGAFTSRAKSTITRISKFTSDYESLQIRIYPDYNNSQSGNVYDFANWMVIDLTLMFGATVADYIYSLETATAGAGVAFFRSLFNKPYYPYNAGTLMSVKTSAHKMVGFNQFVESNLNSLSGITQTDDGWEGTGVNWNRSTNVEGWENVTYFPNTAYCATVELTTRESGSVRVQWEYTDGTSTVGSLIPANTHGRSLVVSNPAKTIKNCHLTFGSVGAEVIIVHNFCISFSEPSKNGTYEPYTEVTYPLSSIDLRGIPTIVDGKLKYDGDVYKSDGTVERRYKLDDLATITWQKRKTGTVNDGYSASLSSYYKAAINAGYTPPFLCDKYEAKGSTNATFIVANVDTMEVGLYGFRYNGSVDTIYLVVPTGSTISGNLVYELAEPTTEQAEPYTNPQVCYPDGTEEYIDTRDVPIPVGHNTKYMRDLKKLLEGIPDAPSANGTYVLKATVSASGVTYSWVEG